MAGGTTRTIFSTLAVLLLVVGTFCMVILIFDKTDVVRKLEYKEWYQVGAAVANVFAVLFISYLIMTSGDRSKAYKIFITVLLIAGLVAEIVLTNVFANLDPQYATYIVIVFNFLFRVYMMVQLTQEPWEVMTFSSTSVAAPIATTIAPPPSVMEKVQDADSDKFIEQWKSIFRQAREKVGRDNFDETSREKARQEIIDPALKAGDFSKDRLKAAAGYLKDKAGNAITDLVFGGGRRRKR